VLIKTTTILTMISIGEEKFCFWKYLCFNLTLGKLFKDGTHVLIWNPLEIEVWYMFQTNIFFRTSSLMGLFLGMFMEEDDFKERMTLALFSTFFSIFFHMYHFLLLFSTPFLLLFFPFYSFVPSSWRLGMFNISFQFLNY
jgi:hypothetical protein